MATERVRPGDGKGGTVETALARMDPRGVSSVRDGVYPSVGGVGALGDRKSEAAAKQREDRCP